MIGVPKIPAQREEERMNTRKTVLTVLVILLLVFYIVSMAYIQSLHRQIEDINSYSRSLRDRSSYYRSNTYAGPSPKPSAYPSQRSAASPGSARREIDTGPSTDGFYHAEDFYDWYKDDFIDYEDAEEYYYEHGGN